MSDGYYMRAERGPRPAPRRKAQLIQPGSPAWDIATSRLDWYDKGLREQAQLAAIAADRRRTITTSMFASGPRKAMAEHLADRTDVPADQAVAMLRVADGSIAQTTPRLSKRVPHELGALGILDDGRGRSAASSWDSVISQVWADRKGQQRTK